MMMHAVSDEDVAALQKIEESSKKLQEQGNYNEALEYLERGLVIRNHFFGRDSQEVKSACIAVGELCNLLAMKHLDKHNYSLAQELLRKAEVLTKRDPKSLAVTYNNLACYYRRNGKLRTSLQCLQKALRLESKFANTVKNQADTYLNMCAVLSQLGRHQSALEHAQSALIMLHEKSFTNDNAGHGITSETIPFDRITVLAIAYYNIGVQQEYLKKHDCCILSYQKGLEIAQRSLGNDHTITSKLKEAYMSAKSLEESRTSNQVKKKMFEKKERFEFKQTMRRLKKNLETKKIL